MNNFLHQKTAVVTGGARGIGRAIAARLAREGAAVAIGARTTESVASAVVAVVELKQETGIDPPDRQHLSDTSWRLRDYAGIRRNRS
jgi:NAD(P)-dependent dehydrogenase (short-subunit alcohol dehydrogenase family)